MGDGVKEMKALLRKETRLFLKTHIMPNPQFTLDSGERVLQKFKALFESKLLIRNVSIFISKHPEISTVPLIRYFYLLPNVAVYLPAWAGKLMWMCKIDSYSDYEQLQWQTPGDKIPMPENSPPASEDIVYDLIIMPGLVFDERCHRLGYGYGHYDYFLHHLFQKHPRQKSLLIGIGLDDQCLPSGSHIPSESHDIQLDYVLTPQKTIQNHNRDA